MNLFDRFRAYLQRFMSGRYGTLDIKRCRYARKRSKRFMGLLLLSNKRTTVKDQL